MSAAQEAALRLKVGEALRAARRARGMTQAEVAGPYTAAFVSRVEHGDAIPSLGSLKLMADRLSMSLSQFFELVEEADGFSAGTAQLLDVPSERE